ncbi:cysteine sulfinic acid decarboxylase isoform X2 [Cinclus cinclus]|uniref:cysteine sulfinic acid decarboxylase isoform X2 n=1 Tax=Cinclus cinclus TaxID=127875 RepID=UPI002E13BD0F
MAEPSGIWDSIPLDDPGLDITAGEEFLQEVFQILLEEGVRKSTDVTQKVCDWKEPQELRELLDLELRNDGEGQERLLQRCRDVLRLSVRTGHPRFFNQLFSGLDHHALAGRFLTETLNTSPYTYEVAPVLVLMEEQVLAKLRELVGWSSGDGIFAPGGSMSNMLAMNVARFQRFPESRSRGNWDLPRLGLFASQESHYSILKGAALLGIGTDNVHLVRTDERGKMIPEELEKEIQRVKAEGSEPLFVCATSGTTVLGSFDPLDAIADICAHHGLWLHVDAAWGGSALLSPQLRHLLAGIHRADSVTWNPHKLLMVGLQCSAFLLHDSSVGALAALPRRGGHIPVPAGQVLRCVPGHRGQEPPVRPPRGRPQALDPLESRGNPGAGTACGAGIRCHSISAGAGEEERGIPAGDGARIPQPLLLVHPTQPEGPGQLPRILGQTGKGGPSHQGKDDPEGLHDGGIPTPWIPGQLLPADYHQSCCHPPGLGLLPG